MICPSIAVWGFLRGMTFVKPERVIIPIYMYIYTRARFGHCTRATTRGPPGKAGFVRAASSALKTSVVDRPTYSVVLHRRGRMNAGKTRYWKRARDFGDDCVRVCVCVLSLGEEVKERDP